jgi:PIN domain nuclease of toxin-antitoxin system
MVYLLDTHSFLWTVFDTGKLSQTARNMITEPDNRILVSSISFWEISLKSALGKLELVDCTPKELPGIATQMGLECIALQPDHAASFYQLPRRIHKDPFDRMLVWLAIQEHWVLISKDQQIANYAQYGLRTVW